MTTQIQLNCPCCCACDIASPGPTLLYNTLQFVLNGITNNVGCTCCPSMNGNYILTLLPGAPGSCIWQSNSVPLICPACSAGSYWLLKHSRIPAGPVGDPDLWNLTLVGANSPQGNLLTYVLFDTLFVPDPTGPPANANYNYQGCLAGTGPWSFLRWLNNGADPYAYCNLPNTITLSTNATPVPCAPCCPGRNLPATLYVTLTGMTCRGVPTPVCACVVGTTFTMNQLPTGCGWDSGFVNFGTCGTKYRFVLHCATDAANPGGSNPPTTNFIFHGGGQCP